MSVIAFVSMVPIGKEESVSSYVARVVDIVDRSGLDYVLTPMGTVIEGESWDEVMDVIKRGFESLKEDCRRVDVFIKIDYREGRSKGIVKKLKSVEEKIGRDIKRVI